MLHENDAAAILRDLCQNEHMTASEPKEGKIELKATVDGVFELDEERLDAVNDIDDVMIATIAQHYPVKAGAKLAGMRVIPLVIEKGIMEQVRVAAGNEPLLRLLPYRKMKVGVVTTGSEVFHGRIKDTFTPVLDSKLRAFGLRVDEHRLSDDGTEHTRAAIAELLDMGMDMVLCTGGMSVDPDDRTPAAIKATGARVVTYGAPVLPGAMFMLSYYEKEGRQVPIMGLPGCVMYSPATIFDIVLPRVVAGSKWTRRQIRRLGIGGLCMECKVCHYPVCPFGK
jgi:molybdopterin-binding domain protein